MAWNASRDLPPPTWLRLPLGPSQFPNIPQVPVSRFVTAENRLPPQPPGVNPNGPMGHFTYQPASGFMSMYDASRLRGPGMMGQIDPDWHDYNTTMNPQWLQNAGFPPGMIMDRAAVPFDPNSASPFVDRVQLVGPHNHGVIKIQNIPYGITMAEVHQFICKHVSPNDLLQVHRDGFPLHIIMERSTGKTMDAFVEVNTPEIAEEAIERSFRGMRNPRLGQRHVMIESSTQGQLLHEMFPRARSIIWDDNNFGAPRMVETTDPYSSGFKSFMTEEELNGMIRHAESPQRSPFAIRSLQRTFECMISTLYKFPWYADTLYKMSDRDVIWQAYEKLLKVLVYKVVQIPSQEERPSREVGLDNKLLMDFIFAGMNCPSFSERQKYRIISQSAGAGQGVYLSQHARMWPFQTLSPHPANISDQDLGMWLHIFDLGLNAYKNETPGVPVGIQPHMELENLGNGKPVFRASESGMQLTRRAYQDLEKSLCERLVKKGWVVYLGQYGLVTDGGNDDIDPSDIVGYDDDGDLSPCTAPSGQAGASGPGPAVITSARDLIPVMNRPNMSDGGSLTPWSTGLGVLSSGENSGRISTGRRNSGNNAASDKIRAKSNAPAFVPPQVYAPSTPQALRRNNRAIEIRNPDGSPVGVPSVDTTSASTTSTVRGGAGHDGNASTTSGLSTPSDRRTPSLSIIDQNTGALTAEEDIYLRAFAPPRARRGSGLSSSLNSEHGRTASGASSIYNAPVIRSIRGSPSRSVGIQDIQDSPLILTPTRSSSTSTNVSPTRTLRRMSGATVSPNRHASRSIVSARVSPHRSARPSYSCESSFGSVLDQSGVNNPFDKATSTTTTTGPTTPVRTGGPGTTVTGAMTSPFMRMPNFTRTSPGHMRSYGIVSSNPHVTNTTTATASAIDRSDVNIAPASTFDPGPIGNGARSVSTSTTGTVIRRTVTFAPEDTIVEDEEEEEEGFGNGGAHNADEEAVYDAYY